MLTFGIPLNMLFNEGQDCFRNSPRHQNCRRLREIEKLLCYIFVHHRYVIRYLENTVGRGEDAASHHLLVSYVYSDDGLFEVMGPGVLVARDIFCGFHPEISQ